MNLLNTKMPGIRSLHESVFSKSPSTSNAMAKVRELCYEGSLKYSTIEVASGHQPTDMVIPTSSGM